MINEGLAEAISRAGSPALLAAKLGLKRQAIYQWDKIPASRVIAIEAVTGVPREKLRPDLYPAKAAE